MYVRACVCICVCVRVCVCCAFVKHMARQHSPPTLHPSHLAYLSTQSLVNVAQGSKLGRKQLHSEHQTTPKWKATVLEDFCILRRAMCDVRRVMCDVRCVMCDVRWHRTFLLCRHAAVSRSNRACSPCLSAAQTRNEALVSYGAHQRGSADVWVRDTREQHAPSHATPTHLRCEVQPLAFAVQLLHARLALHEAALHLSARGPRNLNLPRAMRTTNARSATATWDA